MSRHLTGNRICQNRDARHTCGFFGCCRVPGLRQHNIVPSTSRNEAFNRPSRQRNCSQRLQATSYYEVFQVADIVSVGRSITDLTVGVGIVAALSWSALPVLSPPKGSKPQEAQDDDAEGIKWGVMSVLSFIPLFNWLAWIFAAFEDQDRASYYYLLAALYGLPQLGVGFQQDWFSIATLLLGIAHVQIERVAKERGVARPFTLDPSLQNKPAQASKLIEDTARTFADVIQSNARAKDLKAEEESKDYDAEELQQWDQRLKKKNKQGR